MSQVYKFSLEKKYLLLSTFLNNKVRHGGVKRADQIKELLSRFDVLSANPYLSIGKSVKLSLLNPSAFLEGLCFSIVAFFKGISIKGLILFSFKSVEIIKIIRANSDREIILEGGGNLPIIVMNYLIYKKLKFNTFLQNIEYLVPENNRDNYFKSSKDKYFLELKGYKGAKSIFTISDLDSAILGCQKIHSETILYFPAAKDLKKLKTIQNIRNKSVLNKKSCYILLLGTVANPPTRQGMLTAINSFKNQNSKYKLKVAGFGTDIFNHLNSSNINILGSVTEKKLQELMLEAKCLIVNQAQTTGFLIKIVDFNLAGIPILITSKYYQGYHLERYGIFRAEYNQIPKILSSSNFKSDFDTFKKPKL